MKFKYVRIEGRELASSTMRRAGIFSMLWKLIQEDKLEDEDADLFREIDSWFAEVLPFPPQCKNQEKVICFFKTENTEEMMKMITPAMWLLEKYKHPFYVIYTNFPGEIVYEDKYQVVCKIDNTQEVKDFHMKWIDGQQVV